MAGCAAVTAFVSPGHFESEKAVLRVIGSNLNVIVDLSQGSRWRLRDAVEAVMTSENNGIWTALRCASRVSEKKESAPSTLAAVTRYCIKRRPVRARQWSQ